MPGLEAIAAGEASRLLGARLVRGAPASPAGSGGLQVTLVGPPGATDVLKTVLAVYLVLQFDIPRPKALLGHEHFRALMGAIARVRSYRPPDSFQSFYLSAAGRDSSVMRRLRSEIAAASGLVEADEAGDLLIRLRRPAGGRAGWEALLRLTPRPLATRAWRRCDFPGALNASVAHAMALMGGPLLEEDVYLNLCCGSGTLLIEQIARQPLGQVLGCDVDPRALVCAVENLSAARAAPGSLLRADASRLPLEAASVSALAADLPFGGLVGSHRENRRLYPAILAEAGRVARPGARFLLITHEIRLMEAVLRETPGWVLEEVLPINLSGLHPRIYRLRRER